MSLQYINHREAVEESGVAANRRGFMKAASIAAAAAALPIGAASLTAPAAAQTTQRSGSSSAQPYTIEHSEAGRLGGVGTGLRLHEHQR